MNATTTYDQRRAAGVCTACGDAPKPGHIQCEPCLARKRANTARHAEFWRWTDIERQVVLTERPQFGGEFSPMTDFTVLQLRRRSSARRQGEPTTTLKEYW